MKVVLWLALAFALALAAFSMKVVLWLALAFALALAAF
jgi:hypothetical protein